MQISKVSLQTSVRIFGVSFTSITNTQGMALSTEVVEGTLFVAVVDQRKSSSSFGQKSLIPVSACSLLVPVLEPVVTVTPVASPTTAQAKVKNK